eukprot:scaffold174779_cov39-Tisochrysis_lutea.AAC.2
MLHADAGEGAGQDVPAGPAETLAEPGGGRAGHKSASGCMCMCNQAISKSNKKVQLATRTRELEVPFFS